MKPKEDKQRALGMAAGLFLEKETGFDNAYVSPDDIKEYLKRMETQIEQTIMKNFKIEYNDDDCTYKVVTYDTSTE
jgi:hypothetical protein